MTLPKLLSLTSASLFFLDFSAGDPSIALSGPGQCMEELNTARLDAGLSAFEQASDESRLPSEWRRDNIWGPVCDSLLNNTEPGSKGIDVSQGLYALMVLDGTGPHDCNQVIRYFQRGVAGFNGLPPTKTEQHGPYSIQDNVSFIATYNPEPDASIDCRIAFCQAEGNAALLPNLEGYLLGKGQDSGVAANPNTQQSGGFLGGVVGMIPSLGDIPGLGKMFQPGQSKGAGSHPRGMFICKSSPNVLEEDRPPFTQEQWKKITSVVSGANFTTLSPLVAISAAAIAVALL